MDTQHVGIRKTLFRMFSPRVGLLFFLIAATAGAAYGAPPVPLLAAGKPVTWWFVFKLNASVFPECSKRAIRSCPFGGDVQPYTSFGQQYVYDYKDDSGVPRDSTALQQGDGCLGDTEDDPVGATFDEIYHTTLHYVVWNDQFYQDPTLPDCSGDSCGSPWGHSKGILAWDDSGEGLVMQVTTPSWPGSGSALHPRASNDNSLGCVINNDVKFSQHFFALKLTHDDLLIVLQALANASVVTDPKDEQIASNNGGPVEVVTLVNALGKKSSSVTATRQSLSTGVQVISKPSALHVPPWQLVSSLLGGVPLRTATWWTRPAIPSTLSAVDCWDDSLHTPGSVAIATSGTFAGKPFSLKAGPSANGNHAKIGVSTDSSHYTIFGDMNQQGAIGGGEKACGSSQNGRGGIFFVVQDAGLSARVTSLLRGDTAPTD